MGAGEGQGLVGRPLSKGAKVIEPEDFIPV